MTAVACMTMMPANHITKRFWPRSSSLEPAFHQRHFAPDGGFRRAQVRPEGADLAPEGAFGCAELSLGHQSLAAVLR
jgi:hypothetical protein